MSVELVTAKKIEIVRKPCLADFFMIIGATVIWGGSFAATKVALGQSDPITILWLRFIISIPVLMLGAYVQNALRLPTKKEVPVLFAMGFQGIFFHQWIQAYAMKTASAANANWVIVSSPALVAILGRVFLKEKISKPGVAGLVFSAIGVTMVLAFGTIRNAAFPGFGSSGDLILIASALNWAAFSIISRKFLLNNTPPSFTILWEIVFSLLCATVFLFATNADFSKIMTYNATTLNSIIFLGMFSSALAYLFWFQGLSKLPAARVVVFQFIQPLTGIIVSYFLVGERFTIWLFIGGAMIAGGVYLVNKR